MLSLEPRHRLMVEEILKRVCPQARVFAFGSRAQGTARRTSDLDLAIDAGKPIPLLELARIREAMSESDIPFFVDVVDWHDLNEAMRTHVLAAGEILQEREP